MVSIFDNPDAAARPALSKLASRLQSKMLDESLQQMADEDFGEDRTRLLHSAGPGRYDVGRAQFEQKVDAVDAIKRFNQFIDASCQEFGANYLAALSSEDYKKAINSWSTKLYNSVIKLKLEASTILVDRIEEETSEAKKFFLKASLDLITEPHCNNASAGLIHSDYEKANRVSRVKQVAEFNKYFQSLPPAAAAQILKQAIYESKQGAVIVKDALLGHKDRAEIITGLDGFSDYNADRSKIIEVLDWLLSLKKLEAIPEEKLTTLVAEALDQILRNYSNEHTKDRYPDFADDRSFLAREAKLERRLRRGLGKELWHASLKKLLFGDFESAEAKINCLRYLADATDLESLKKYGIGGIKNRQFVIDTCNEILARSNETETIAAGLTLDSIIILSYLKREDLVIEAIKNEFTAKDRQPYLLYLAAGAELRDQESFRWQLIQEIANLKDKSAESKAALEQHPNKALRSINLPMGQQYPDAFLYDNDDTMALIKSLNGGEESEIFNLNAIELLSNTGEGTIESLIEKTDVDEEVTKFVLAVTRLAMNED